ncbi:MAG TPA: hypothetical protein VN493_27285 [Thermoanaerobaculia bacterium]|nr:hypothetical protein [Thermoanaerobaculia bacterium]
MKRLLSALLAVLGGLALVPTLAATVVPQLDPLHGLVVAPAGFVATPAPRELSQVQGELSAATLADVSAFHSAAGSEWKLWIDRRSGAVALVEGQGLPWASGGTSTSALEAKARALIADYPNLFQVPASQLVLDARNTRQFGDRGQFWNVAFNQVIGGVPVDGASIVFRVSHGNLVQFGVNRAIPVSAGVAGVQPTISAAAAKANLATFLGGLLSGDQFLQDGVLSWVQRGTADEVGYTGPIGGGWQPALVYRFLFTRADSIGTWLSLVDARTGQVLRFVDANDYVSVLKGSALTEHNCADPSNCVPGTAEELPVTMPNAKLTFVGGACSGNGCYTNSAGAFNYPAGALSATATLEGKYFNFVDGCGPIAATTATPGNPDLGTSDPVPNVNTDCHPAHRESAPNSGPLFGGTGDTHSARTIYYHLNLINQKSRFYLPHNQWLKGVDGTDVVPTVLTNGPPACNAFWAGGQDLFAFLRLTPGLGCNNTGEVPAVGLHEFGHGLDEHDGTGDAPEQATGEAMGDTFALLQGQKACFGSGFRLPDATDPWANTAGYGDANTGSKSRLCTGVRELDYTRLCSQGSGPDCAAPRDPDAPNGSRSGLNPPANPVDAGTPARWNHMIETAPMGTPDGLSNFYDCGGPETTGCAGPLNHGCHCESSIPSQANWDLAKQLISAEFGGNVYADPPGPAEVSGWQYMDRLWYLTRDLAVSGYSVTGPFPEGTTNGCTVTDWYSTYRFIDDDNGNLADGTPHADILFSAFDLHGIACGAASDPDNQGSGCPAPIAASTAGTCGADAPVQLTWTPSAGTPAITEYRVLRNTLGCGFGFTPVGTVGGSRTFFEDSEVAPGVTYYYSIQPVGQNASCYGQVSNCVTVTPSACGAVSVPPPSQVTLSNAGPNAIQVDWTAAAGAGSYKILRKAGSCSSSSPEAAVGVVAALGTTFVDQDGIVGGQTYSYRVASSAGTCASCAGAPSACESVEATGDCDAPPAFAGVKSVTSATDGSCRLDVKWDAATPGCGGATISYDVFRSTDPDFTPSAANRIATGVTGTSYADESVTSGTRYTYIVRAVDSNGNSDGNLARRTEAPAGQLTPGTFQDDAGDTLPVKLRGWAIRNSGPNNATKHYATSAEGNYPGNACLGLESDTIHLGANPTLSFRSRYDLETGWDGGYVEVATEETGFTNWTKLGSVNYPAVMAGPLGEPACGGPGFADGQPVFTGTSLLDQWSNHSGSLSAYANKTVRIRFLFSSDGATEQGGWFVDDVQVAGARLAGPCSNCRFVDDSDAAVERYAFFFKADANASNGGYHIRTGKKSQAPQPYVKLAFQGDTITYHYATSRKGGEADVFIDGQLRETISYYGPTYHVEFGASKTYSGLGAGPHEIKIILKFEAVYVDGFTLGDCGQALASAVEYTTTTTSSKSDLSLGPIVTKQIQVGPDDGVVSVLVEGGSKLMTVRILDSLGQVVATGSGLLVKGKGFTESGVDASVSKPGTYTVQVLRPLGVTGGQVEISIAKTARIP